MAMNSRATARKMIFALAISMAICAVGRQISEHGKKNEAIHAAARASISSIEDKIDDYKRDLQDGGGYLPNYKAAAIESLEKDLAYQQGMLASSASGSRDRAFGTFVMVIGMIVGVGVGLVYAYMILVAQLSMISTADRAEEILSLLRQNNLRNQLAAQSRQVECHSCRKRFTVSPGILVATCPSCGQQVAGDNE